MFWRRQELYRDKALERLASPDDLDEPLQLVAPKDWIALAVVGALLALALLWACVGHVTTTVSVRGLLVAASAGAARPAGARAAATSGNRAAPDGRVEPRDASGALVNVAYVPVAQSRRLRAGMPVQVSPDSAPWQRFGGVTGAITTISADAATSDRAGAARDLLIGCPCVEVTSALERDATTRGGHRWSSSRGPSFALSAGERTTLRVIVDRQRPITLLLPFLRSTEGQ